MNVLVLWSIAGFYSTTYKLRSRSKREKARLSRARKTSIDNALCFSRYAPTHQFYYHDVNDPLTGVLKDIPFDAVIFDTTVSSLRCLNPFEEFLELKDRYSFISDWDCAKVAFPQDDYDCSALLDEWLAEYGFDIVFSPVSDRGADIYPEMTQRGRILPVLTGYVNDADIDRTGSFAKSLDERRIDIGYRARFLPARFGRHGQVKGLLAERMLAALDGHDVVADISTDANRVFLGEDWLRFLGDCKFCLGSETGSSLWDPRGEIAARTAEYQKSHPDACFDAIEAACFPGEDGRLDFSAISPRIFEAALVRCGQILIEGNYLEEMEPWVHYLPIDERCESAPEVLDRMRDRDAMQRMIDACYDAIIATPRYRYSTHVAAVMERITDLVAEKRVQGISPQEFEKRIARHRLISDAKRHLNRKPVRWIRNVMSTVASGNAGAQSDHKRPFGFR